MQRRLALTLTVLGGLLVLGSAVSLGVARRDGLRAWWETRGLRSAHAETRVAALERLRTDGTERAVGPVLRHMMELDGKERAVAYRALTALSERHPTRAAEEFAAGLDEDRRVLGCIACGPSARIAKHEVASQALGRALVRLLGSEPEPSIRRGAISLGSRLPHVARAVLEEGARDEDAGNRALANWLLPRAGSRSFAITNCFKPGNN